jgi:uncharacterized membrane protein YfcA
VLVGAFVQAVVGLGVGLVTAPLVTILEPSLMPSLPLWFGVLVSGASLFGERHHVDWSGLAWALPARVPGTLLGVWLVVVFSSRQLGVAVGVMVLVTVGLSLRAVSVPITRGTLLLAGFTAGTAGTATSIGGPPLALLYQLRRPAEVRSTLAVFFFAGTVLSVVGLALAGELPLASVAVAAVVSPFLVAGIWLGVVFRGRLPRERFRRSVLAVCGASAVVLLVRSLG